MKAQQLSELLSCERRISTTELCGGNGTPMTIIGGEWSTVTGEMKRDPKRLTLCRNCADAFESWGCEVACVLAGSY